MGWFTSNSVGDITAASNEWFYGGIEYNDDALMSQIIATPYDYKWINEAFIHRPRPSVYHVWNGTQWNLSQQLLKAARDDIWEQIKNYRQERQYLGVKITTAQGEFWVHSDEASRSLHLGLVGAAILHILHNSPFNVPGLPYFPSDLAWKTMQKDANGQPIFIQLDYVRALQIFAADKDMTALCFQMAEYHRVMVENHPDPLNYNYRTNWPPVFEGTP